MNPWLLTGTQTAFVLLLAPFSIGLVRTCKARLQGRRGASPFLVYRSLATMCKKENIVSTSASWVSQIAPYGVLGPLLLLATLLPTMSIGGVFAENKNLFLIAGLFVFSALFLILGAMDVGGAFGGMGASRESTLLALTEPVFIMSLVGLALVKGSMSVDGMVAVGEYDLGILPFLLLPFAALLLASLAENTRYPVDNPATHLELTMVHEAMILNTSGYPLAMFEYAACLKITLLALFLANIVFPFNILEAETTWIAVPLALLTGFVKVTVMMALLALLESVIAKMRFYRLQEYMSVAFLFALGGVALALVRIAFL